MAREYDIAKASGRCGRCQGELAPGSEYVSALLDAGEEFRREDYCCGCWEARGGDEPQAFSVWRSRVPMPEEKKGRFVGPEVLIDFFNRLEGHDEPAKVSFRFVLALMLMRKKLLNYAGSGRDEAGRDVWTMTFRHDQRQVQVVDPHLDDAKIVEVTAHVGALFEAQP